MNKTSLYAALDIGATKICCLVAEGSYSGELRIQKTGIAPSVGFNQGVLDNPGEVREAILQAMEATGHSFRDETSTPLYLGVTSRNIRGTQALATWSSSRYGGKFIVSQKEMSSALAACQPTPDSNTRILHVIPRGYTVNGSTTQYPLGQRTNSLKVESHVVLAGASHIDRLLTTVGDAGGKVKGLILDSLASAEVVLRADEKELGVALVDIGGEISSLAMFKRGAAYHTSVIPIGGRHFTNDLTLALDISTEDAEEAKLKYGHVNPDGTMDSTRKVDLGRPGRGIQIAQGEIFRFLRERSEDLIRQISRRIREAGMSRMSHMPPSGIVLTGGGANLRGLDQLAQERLRCPVRVGIPNLSSLLPKELKDPAFATVVGLLLCGIRKPYRPAEIKRDRWPWQFMA
jgi:cell division protein FtsA